MKGRIMVPYYLLKTNDFNPSKIQTLSSSSQTGIKSYKDDTPFSLIKKEENQPIQGYITYTLNTETLKKQCGRAYGNSNIFDSFILIQKDQLFYNKKENLLALSTSKDNFRKFINRFQYNTMFTYSTIPVDFSSIIDNIHNLNTDSVWIGNLNDANINSIGLMGHKVENSSEYKDYLDSGASVTNISFIFDFNGKQEKVMISKDGGIILYQSKPQKDALKLVMNVYEKMLLLK